MTAGKHFELLWSPTAGRRFFAWRRSGPKARLCANSESPKATTKALILTTHFKESLSLGFLFVWFGF